MYVPLAVGAANDSWERAPLASDAERPLLSIISLPDRDRL